MTDKEAVFFRQALSRCSHYLEYGAGGSTVAAADTSSILSVTSVESDPEFFKTRVLPHVGIQKARVEGRLSVHEVDIGPTDAWGMPSDASKASQWPNYSASPFEGSVCQPDLILVDGRFRIACCLMAALNAPSAIILVHDYNARPSYRIVEDFFEVETRIDSIAQLRKKPAAKDSDIRKVWERYATSPDDSPVSAGDHIRSLIWRTQHWLSKRTA